MNAISFVTAESHVWDAIVVGAGPAGAATALRLARGGQRVVLVDRHSMPRGKVCGCCLSPAASVELERLAPFAGSLRLAASPAWIPLAGVRLAAGGRLVRIPLAGGRIVSREALDTALVEAAIRHGAAWLPAASVCSVTDAGNASLDHSRSVSPTPTMRADLHGTLGRSGDADADSQCRRHWTTFETRGHIRHHGATCGNACRDEDVPLVVALRTDSGAKATLRGRRMILAVGLTDNVRIPEDSPAGPPAARGHRTTWPDSRIGLGAVLPQTSLATAHPVLADLPAGELVMAVAAAGYCGIVRLEDGRIDLAAALDRHAVQQAPNPAVAVAEVLTAALGLPAGIELEAGNWRATPPLSGTAPLVAGGAQRIFRVGDAAGYVEPFTGEGIGWALASGRLAADAILETSDAGAAAARYVRDHRLHFSRHHARCRRVARSLRQPRLVQAAVRAAAWWPWAARRLAPLVAGGGS